MDPYAHETVGFEAADWLSNLDNVALTDGEGSFALFERSTPSLVTGHYFFLVRGREAEKLARECLKEIFVGGYGVEVIRGLTPLDKRGALWMNKKLGFTQHDLIETVAGPCALVVLTKKEWEQLDG